MTIPLQCRSVRRAFRGWFGGPPIVAIADAYDAMTSRRSYSAARLPDEAVAVLAANAGTASSHMS